MRATWLIGLAAAALLAYLGCNQPRSNTQMSSGERLFRANCRSCHILPKATVKTDEQWPEIVRRYGEKAKLSTPEIEQITLFLVMNN